MRLKTDLFEVLEAVVDDGSTRSSSPGTPGPR